MNCQASNPWPSALFIGVPDGRFVSCSISPEANRSSAEWSETNSLNSLFEARVLVAVSTLFRDLVKMASLVHFSKFTRVYWPERENPWVFMNAGKSKLALNIDNRISCFSSTWKRSEVLSVSWATRRSRKCGLFEHRRVCVCDVYCLRWERFDSEQERQRTLNLFWTYFFLFEQTVARLKCAK